MASIFIYNYNNYYNRKVKKEDALIGYGSPVYTESSTNLNFNPNDGVTTAFVAGRVSNSYNGRGDYLIYSEDNTSITSRWFVLEATRARKGQYNLVLKRDVIVDNYDAVINAPTYIERATVGDNDPAIYNREQMGFNEILKNVEPLKDASGCAWLVGYAPAHSIINTTIKYNVDLVPEEIVNSESELSFYDLLNKDFTGYSDIGIDVYFKNGGGGNGVSFNSFNRYGDISVVAKNENAEPTTGFGWVVNTSKGSGNMAFAKAMYSKTPVQAKHVQIGSTGGIVDLPIWRYSNDKFSDYIRKAIPDSSWETIKDQVAAYLGTPSSTQLNKYVNKIYKVGGKYYVCELQSSETALDWSAPIEGYKLPVVENIVRSAYNTSISGYSAAVAIPSKGFPSFTPTTITDDTPTTSTSFMSSIRVSNSVTAKLVLTEYKGQTTYNAKITTDASNLTLSDAPYDMFCMPYSDDLVIKTKEGDIVADKGLAMATMWAIGEKYSGAKTVFDIQLLPYCPLIDYIDTVTGKLDMTKSSSLAQGVTNYYYITTEEGSGRIGVLLYCGKSTGNIKIAKSIPITEKKIQVCCDKYRLCSPNYSDIFEFNAAFNNGVDYFNIDYTYKPFSPYIHVNPNFKEDGLYGKNIYNNKELPRGLVCGGEFSITMLTDAFQTYALQNKNFELSFQRQIKNMEVQQSVARTQDIWSGVTGAMQGASIGATVGSVGGAVGAVAGAVVGGLASAAGGAGDYALNEKLRKEALSYTKDMHSYQIGNIKALPDTLTKLTTLTANNQIFPVLEYYSCTDTEKDALRDEIKYGGMTVNRIGYINQFIQPEESFISGRIIRLASISDDYHMVSAIADEIKQGVYI